MNIAQEHFERLKKETGHQEFRLYEDDGKAVTKHVYLCTDGVTFKEAIKILNNYYKKVKESAENNNEKENNNEQ